MKKLPLFLIAVLFITGCNQNLYKRITHDLSKLETCFPQRVFKEQVFYGDDYWPKDKPSTRAIVGNKYSFYIGLETHSGILGLEDFHPEKFKSSDGFGPFIYHNETFDVHSQVEGRYFHEIKKSGMVIGYYNCDSIDHLQLEACYQQFTKKIFR